MRLTLLNPEIVKGYGEEVGLEVPVHQGSDCTHILSPDPQASLTIFMSYELEELLNFWIVTEQSSQSS